MQPPELFWLDGACCTDFGLALQGPVTFAGAQPRVGTVQVPGRNGELCFFDGSYANLEGRARCFALDAQDVSQKLDAITGWILRNPGYRRLMVSQERETYRLARVAIGPANEIRMRRLAPFEIAFDCKPQKYLLSGEREISLAGPSTLHNPYAFAALPRITVYGSGPGNLQVGDTTVQIRALNGWVTLDSELQNAYKIPAPGQPAQNKNSAVFAPEFPALAPGGSAVSWTGGIERVEVAPRWWTL